jgi:hypothetical protein
LFCRWMVWGSQIAAQPYRSLPMPRRPALPKDPSQRAKALLDMATGEAPMSTEPLLSAAQEFARKGGLQGGKARAKVLTAGERKAIAQKAAASRWAKAGKNGKSR